MKWKTLAGLALALAGWSRFSEDLPSHDLIAPGEPPFKPTCKNGERLSWDPSVKRWICIPKPITCPAGQYATWNNNTKRWVCVPKL